MYIIVLVEEKLKTQFPFVQYFYFTDVPPFLFSGAGAEFDPFLIFVWTVSLSFFLLPCFCRGSGLWTHLC